MYAQRIAEPVDLWFLSRPEYLTIIGLLLLEHCVFEVDFFPNFGRGESARDVSGNNVVVGRGRGVFVKRRNNASQSNNLDYGRGREACNCREMSTKEAYLASVTRPSLGYSVASSAL